MANVEKPLHLAKQERFAQEVANGSTLDAAYRTAGYSPNRANAGKLRQLDGVSLRIEYLLGLRAQVQTEATQQAVQAMGLTKAWVIQQAKDVLAEARESKEHTPALKAIELLGREVSAFIEKKEIRTGPLEGIDPDELDRIRAEIVSERARRVGDGSDAPSQSKPH